LSLGPSLVTWPLIWRLAPYLAVEAEVLSAHEERDAALSELRQKRSIEAELLQSSARFEQQIASNSSAFEEEKAALLTQIGGLKEEFEKFKKANDGKKKPPTDPALDGMSVIDQIRYTLKKNAARVLDLFREWDEDGDGQVSKTEFRRAIPMLGLEVANDQIDALFDEFDKDGGGEIGLSEMQKMLRRGATGGGSSPSPSPGGGMKRASAGMAAAKAIQAIGGAKGSKTGGLNDAVAALKG